MIRVLLVEDHTTFRRALTAVLDDEPDVQVVGEAADGTAVEDLAGVGEFDVAVVDLDLPGRDGIEVIRMLLRARPATRCIVLTGLRDERELGRAVQAGAVAVLHKSIEIEELVDSIVRVAQGANLLAPHETTRWLDALVSAHDEQARAQLLDRSLTPRERDVLQLLAHGGTSASIAEDLTLSLHTVQTHVRNILAKLQVGSRGEAVALAVRLGLVDPPTRYDADRRSRTT